MEHRGGWCTPSDVALHVVGGPQGFYPAVGAQRRFPWYPARTPAQWRPFVNPKLAWLPRLLVGLSAKRDMEVVVVDIPRAASWQDYLLHIRLLWHAAPKLSTACLVLSTLQALSIVSAMLCIGKLIGALSTALEHGSNDGPVWFWLGATAAALISTPLLGAISGALEKLVSARYLSAYHELLLDSALRPNTVDKIQSQDGAQAIGSAADSLQDWLFLSGVSGLWGVLGSRLSGAGSLVVVASWKWWMAILLLLGWLAMSRATARWRSVVFDDTSGRAVPLRHRASYLYSLVSERSSAKEIRIFGLADWLVEAHTDLARNAMTIVSHRRGEGVLKITPWLAVLLVLHIGAFAVLITDTLASRISVTELTTTVQVILGMSSLARQGDEETSLGRTVSSVAKLADLRSSLGLPFLPEPPDAPTLQSHRPATPATVEIADLTFSYPSSDKPVLQHLDLKVEAGECLAIVGENGAGKSTLIALLSGLWVPTCGEIRVNGRDPVTDPGAREIIAPIYQKFLRLPLTAEENVTAGNAWLPGTDWRDAAVAADADSLIDRLENRHRTILSPEFSGGTDLSGGQWQRIALARAFAGIESGAGLLVLDEPTAALDVQSEIALFESVLHRRGSITTLLITHRLSSVRHADRIVVLGRPDEQSGARVIESGTHQQLLDIGGTYARMFRLQAARFQDDA